MEDNMDLNTDLELDNEGVEGADGNDNNTDNNNTDNVTMSKADFDKAIQSAEDKVRGKLSKKIKELEGKIAELSPVEKTEAEIALEERIARLEESEKAVKEREQRLNFQQSLSDKGVDKSLFDFIKEDADVEALATVLSTLIKTNTRENGYVPSEHSSADDITFEDYMAMTYTEKEKFMTEYPEAYRRFQNQKKKH